MHAWLLPEHIEDVLPPEAARVESVRRRLLDLFRAHGYELVIPPLLEYLESLLTGTGRDLELKTFKLVDQLSGRLMGLRADITPQAARIDAHLLNREGAVRLCYADSVVRTLPDTPGETRVPLQIGAELFGHAGLESDAEIQGLMLEALAAIGIRDVHLDLGHMGIVRRLVMEAQLDEETETALFAALQGKDVTTLRELTTNCPREAGAALVALADLYGGPEVLERARRELPNWSGIGEALDDLARLADRLGSAVGNLCFDLGELRGYHYHSGVVFAAYDRRHSAALAQGGRYDNVGKAFGRPRPATGFSMDLRVLADLAALPAAGGAIHSPFPEEEALRSAIAALRARGETVVVDLPGAPAASGWMFDRRLVLRDGRWEVVPTAASN